MKKNIFILLIMAVILGACSKSYLDLIPEDTLTVDGYYQNETDIKQALNGVYNRFAQLPVYHYLYLSEIRSNNLYGISHNAQRDWYDINTYAYSSTTAILYSTWLADYQTINAANILLSKINNVSFLDTTLKKRYKCEARVLRAYTYFELVRAFGKVPLISTPISSQEALSIGLSERSAIYEFITKEMEDVVTNGNLSGKYTTTDIGRITKYGAEALLGRIYLTMAGYPLNDASALAKARTHLENVISAESLATSNVVWATDYSTMFMVANDNKYHLFECQYVGGSTTTGTTYPISVVPADFTATIIPSSSYGIASALELTLPKAFIKTFEAGDKRLSVTMDTLQYTTNTGSINKIPFFSKFLNLSSPEKQSDSRSYGINIPVIRYADVLLMEAEILNSQVGPTNTCTATGVEAGKTAVNLLNKIRTRAGLANVNPATSADFTTALEIERRHEFAFEGIYWHDLVRTGKAVSTMNSWFTSVSAGITITESNLTMPIPQTEIDKGLYQ